jgi:hypothetical protein
MRSYEQLALGEPRKGNNSAVPISPLPDVFSPATQFSKLYDFQSYHDSTLLENALQIQNPNDGIVQSTLDESQVSGYSLGLHPSSQTPVAVQFFQGGMQASSVITLKPGQVWTPFGKPGVHPSQFSGFRFGLPMGWLGGGLATFVVFHTPEAIVRWYERAEIIFHKVTVPIIPLADVTAAANNNARRNWPLRFPWTQALRGSGQVNQKSRPVLGVSPTKVFAALRGVGELADSYSTRFVFQATNDFGIDDDGDPNNTIIPVFQDVFWDSFSSIGTSGNLSTQRPILTFGENDIVTRLAADDGGLAIIDNSGAEAFAEGFVDFTRYGTL